MKIYIKYMVCIRCKMVVKSELERLGIKHFRIELGEVEIRDQISSEQLNQLRIALENSGLQLMEDKRSILVEQIKACIIELVHYSEEEIRVSHSDYVSKKLNHPYAYLAHLFSEVKGITIENFYLTHKIERVKELLVYEELSLSEIAYRLNYSSVAHLSNQFKKLTGLTPSHFKKMKHQRGSISPFGNV